MIFLNCGVIHVFFLFSVILRLQVDYEKLTVLSVILLLFDVTNYATVLWCIVDYVYVRVNLISSVIRWIAFI